MGSAPKPPDPVKTASAQTGMNIGTAIANGYLGQVNEVTPNGSLTYSTTGTEQWTDPATGEVHTIPQRTATQTFSPTGTAINNNTTAAQLNMSQIAKDQSQRLGQHLGGSLSYDGLPQVGNPNFRSGFSDGGPITKFQGGTKINDERIAPAGSITKFNGGTKANQLTFNNGGKITRSYGTDFSGDRAKVEGALMDRMQPGLTQDRKVLEDRLASQGIGIGSEAYQQAMGDYGRQTNDARLGAILAGGQEQSRMVGMEADRAAFQNSAQNQQYGQNLQGMQARNDASQQNFQNVLAAQGFNNAAQQQQFGQNAASQQAGNAARQANFGNVLAAQGFNNAAQGQQFGQNMQRAAFANQGTQQQMDAQMLRRNQGIQERTTLRNQPINEISALLGGSQVSQPNFMNINGPQAATTDYAGIVNANYGQQMQGYNARQQMLGGLLGGVGGIAGAGIGAGWFG